MKLFSALAALLILSAALFYATETSVASTASIHSPVGSNQPLLPVVRFDQIGSATTYDVQISPNSDFSNPVKDMTSVSDAELGNSTIDVPTSGTPLNTLQTYYLRIKVSGGLGWDLQGSFVTGN